MQLGGASTRLRTPPYAGSHCAPPRRPGQPAGAGAPRPGPSPEIFGLLRAIRPPGPGGRPRGVRTPDDTLHRPLARRPGCRLVPACGKQEVDARRSADGQARSGGCWVKALHRSHLEAGDVTGAADLVRNPRPGAPSEWSRAASFVRACENQRTRRERNYCDNPALGVDPRSPRTSAPPSGLAGPKAASAHPLTRPKRPCGGRTGRRVGARCSARPDVPAGGVLVGRSRSAVHVGPRRAAPRTAAPSQDALLGVFTFEKALSKNTGGGGGPGGARPWAG